MHSNQPLLVLHLRLRARVRRCTHVGMCVTQHGFMFAGVCMSLCVFAFVYITSICLLCSWVSCGAYLLIARFFSIPSKFKHKIGKYIKFRLSTHKIINRSSSSLL